MNNKGFVISSILYPLLVLFLAIIMALLSMSDIRKRILDKMRLEISDLTFDEATCSCDTITKKLNYIIKNGVGRTLQVNIKIYETPVDLPNEEEENVVSVITTSPYNGIYIVSPDEPVNPTSGMLWIVKNEHANAYLRTDTNEISISHVMQYVDQKWNLLEAYIYNGEYILLNGKINFVLLLENGTIEGGKTLKNLVTNGSFENGTKGWYAYRTKDGVSTPNTLKTEDTSIFSSLYKSHGIRSYHNLDTSKNANYYAFQEFNIPIGNKLYIRAMKKGTGTNDFVIMTYNGESEDQEIKAKYVRSEKNGLSLHSGYGNTKYLTKQFLQLGSCGACLGDYYIDDIMTFDLTNDFGAGKEPTQAILDLVPYFESSASMKYETLIAGENLSFKIEANDNYEYENQVVCDNGATGYIQNGIVTISHLYSSGSCKINAKNTHFSTVEAPYILNGYSFYDNSNRLIKGTFGSTQSNVTAGMVLSGYKIYTSDGTLITGSLSNFSNGRLTTDVSHNENLKTLNIYTDRGAYVTKDSSHNNKAYITIPYSNMRSNLSIYSGNIKAGESINGVWGTYALSTTAKGIHITERGSNYCGADWYLTSDIEAGTYLVVNVMYFSPGIVSGSDMSLYKSSSAGADSVTSLSVNRTSYNMVHTYLATLNASRKSGTAMGRMSNCASGNYGSIYGKSVWVKVE